MLQPLFNLMKGSVCILICVAGCLVVAGSATADSDGLEAIRKGAKQIQSLQADFVQKKQMKILLKPLVSKGRFYFKAPGSIRWEYQTPVSSILTVHQGDIKRFFRKDGKMVPDTGANLEAMQVVMQYITRWLGGHFDENPDFRVRRDKGRVILTPAHSMSGMIDHIELRLSRQAGIIDAIYIYEDDENYTAIEFNKLKINRPVADSVFQEIS